MHSGIVTHRALRAVISGWIVALMGTLLVWSLPPSDNRFLQAYCDWIAPFMLRSGLWQGWSMFAPDPGDLNSWIEARIRYRSGRLRSWEVPRVDTAPVEHRPRLERWKSVKVHLERDSAGNLRSDFIRYVARRFDRPGDPPVAISLVHHGRRVDPPRVGDLQPIDRSLDFGEGEVLFERGVAPGELR